jgi:hypothetical protein
MPPAPPFRQRRPHRYEERVVAFIDVLGLSATLSEPSRAERYAQALAAILSPIIRNRESSWLVLPHVRTGEEIEIQLAPTATKGARTTALSDSILISVPMAPDLLKGERLASILDCLQAVYWLQRSLLALGILTRGGMALGGLIHKSHLVVADGLVKAYKLESEQAIFPRTVIDTELIDLLLAGPLPDIALFRNRVAHMIRQDDDKAYFVDYLTWDPLMGEFYLRDHVERIAKDELLPVSRTPS